jgi:uncharacterized OB-fold protein
MSQSQNLPPSPGAVFAEFLKSGQLRLQVCASCGKQIFYPRTVCPFCGSVALEWREPSGKATVYSTTTVRQKPERGGDYNVSIVEFAEGARMMSRVEGIPPADVKIGMALKADIVQANNEPLLVFRPEGR